MIGAEGVEVMPSARRSQDECKQWKVLIEKERKKERERVMNQKKSVIMPRTNPSTATKK